MGRSLQSRPSSVALTQWLRFLGTRWVLVMRDFEAHFDASGESDPSQRVVVVAGYVSTKREWQKFSSAWATKLRKYGLPYFHMTEFMSFGGGRLFPKPAWTDDRRNALITELIPIVRRAAMFQFTHALPKHEWDAAMSDRAKRLLRDPFSVCFSLVLRDLLRWLPTDLEPGEQVGLVFDQGSEAGERSALWTHRSVKTINDAKHDRLGPLQFADKRKCLPLQAADMPALLHYQFIRDEDYSKGRVREVYQRLCGGIPNKISYMLPKDVREHAEACEKALDEATRAFAADGGVVPDYLRPPSEPR